MAMSAPLDERFSLRVRNLPAVLSTEAVTSLLTHYGATRVRVLQRRNAASSGKEPGAAAPKKLQKAVATFATREAQQNAQRRLNSLELAGHHLQVEVVGDEAATTSTEAKPEAVDAGHTLPLKGQPPLPKGLPPPLPPTPAPVQNPLYAPAPLAPHLGQCGGASSNCGLCMGGRLHYAPSPLLEYKYPKATESINKLSAIKNNAALHGAFQLGAESGISHEVHQLARPGVISKSELERQRVPREGMLYL
ncbi:hypothetical protein PHYSODRAFT_496693 [Phytophthora sojae]|uniref:RRM domain-containing protein n=1 Tax=Phytophthora sojae (strain P6497) TaxID=1094619 RepID=G4Z673_PHYSP|nr:hypothetical protein PHYSODRAFT_496693 [Phytophthora sojae]EGZ21688.1 hypothetical protein PHYSODRAFT_496693 [Phytophthora sojae]|eukprot:XP_009524405.1 hypothetical protein PHYSODRAFT_496693 [Phytophthora sojae]